MITEENCESCIYYPPSSFGGKPCSTCNPEDPICSCYQRRVEIPPTNADRIRAMSDEELAVLLEGCVCPSEPCKKVVDRTRMPDKKMCQSCWLNWLQSQVGGDTE